GDGSFAPDSSDLNATYILGNNDTISAFVTIYLNINNACGLYSDMLNITVTPAPFVDAGQDIVTCSNTLQIQLNGIISAGSSSGIWTTNGSGIFMPSDSILNATYIPSSNDTTNGNIVINLTSTNNGNCIQVSDSFVITFTPTPILSAGSNQTICNVNTANLSGTITNGTVSTQWLTLGTGTFLPDDTSLNVVYTASIDDINNGIVQIILTPVGSTCNLFSDTITLNFISSNSGVDIGSDKSICNGDSISLIPIIQGDTGVFNWSSSGTGIFTPSDSLQNVIFTPSKADIDSGSVYIYLQYNYTCGNILDSLLLSINSLPTASYNYSVDCNSMTASFTNTSIISSGNIAFNNWTFDDGNSSTQQSPIYTYTNFGNYNVELIALSDSGCSDTTSQQITVYQTIVAQFSVSDSTISTSENVIFIDQSVGATSWLWNFGTQSDTIQNPNYTFNNVGEYTVWLYISGAGGCTDSVSHNVSVENHGYAIPTGFSPNGDNLN
ncbi:MAG: hypothetical protein COZ21_00490, partial [Bacteroidetes bacterium CG_4_10_14_3_um_filter_31_20]